MARQAGLPSAPPNMATGYVRLSKAAGTENLSVEGMIADVERKAAELGAQLVGPVHVDNGKSGAIRDRPEFVAWLDDVRECRAGLMIPWATDRLTREGLNVAGVILDAQEGKDPTTGAVVRAPARLVDCAGLDSNDGESFRFRFVIGAEVARAERERMRVRSKEMHARAKLVGRWTGGTPPMGFCVAPNPDGPGKVLAVDPDESAAMRWAMERLVAGATLGAVSRRWNSDGFPVPRRAAQWTITTVKAALTTETANALLWSPGERKALSDVLADRTMFQGQGRAPARLLSGGLLACSGCGKPLGSAPIGGRNPRGIYRCTTRSKGGECPRPVGISAGQIDDHIEAEFLGKWGRLPWAVERVTLANADQLAEAHEAHAVALAAVGVDLNPETLAALQEAQDRLRALEAAPSEMTVENVRTGRTTAEEWAASDVHGRRDMLVSALARPIKVAPGTGGRKTIDPARLEIEWRTDDDYPDAD